MSSHYRYDSYDYSPYASGALPPPRHQELDTYRPDRYGALQVPQTGHGRHSSAPPRRRRSSSSSSSSRDRSPLRKAEHAVKETFSSSNAGLGVGVLGAILGGVAAETLASHSSGGGGGGGNGHHHRNENPKILATLVGAAIGGLGANALEKRIENTRERDREKEQAWEHKWGPARDGHGRARDRALFSHNHDRDDDDRRAASTRPGRGRPGSADDYYNVDDGYDFVYDRKIGRRRSDAGASR